MPSSVGRLATLLTVVVLTGCGDLTGPKSLPLARQLWEAQNRSTYEYVGTRGCFCLGPFGPATVMVVDNRVIGVVEHSTGMAVSTAGWLTVDEMFEEAQRAIEAERLNEIEFDDDEGYPTLIDLCCHEIDSGLRRTITDLRDLQPIPAAGG